MPTVQLHVNGVQRAVDAWDAEMPLLYALRLFAGRARLAMEQRDDAHHHAVGAVAALRRLLGDERRLHRVRPLGTAEAFGGDDAAAGSVAELHRARAHRRIVEQHRARSALAEAAAELRGVQAEVVAERVEKRHLRVPGVDRTLDAVDMELDGRHGGPLAKRTRAS